MRADRIAVHVFDVMARHAGDLSWARNPSTPPACVPPRELHPAQRLTWFAQWDSAGPGMVSRKSWTRIERTIAVCDGCPLVTACLSYALDHETKVEGIWGGMYFPSKGPAQLPPGRVTAAA